MTTDSERKAGAALAAAPCSAHLRAMGELWDEIEPMTKGTPADFWLQEWRAIGDEKTFAEWRGFEATELQVRYFLEDLTHYFAEEMQMIGGEELYMMTLRDGRAVMTKIAETADKFGARFGDAARMPVTPTEMVTMVQNAGADLQPPPNNLKP